MTKWEYKVHVVDNHGDGADTFSIDFLNELGVQGGERLHVNKLQDAANADAELGGTRTKRVALWFKRPKED